MPTPLQRIEGAAEGLAEGGLATGAAGAVNPAATNPSNVVNEVGNAVPGLDQIGKFFNDLTQANTWIRVAEVVLGAGLIIVGIATLMKGTAVGRAAAKAGKAAAIL